MRKASTFSNFAECVHHADTLDYLKSEASISSKKGDAAHAQSLRDQIYATNQIVHPRFQSLLVQDNYPVCGEYKGRSYYVAKDGDSIVFAETKGEQGTYYYRWEWDARYNELSVKDIDSFPIEFSAYTELLDEVTYQLALQDCQRVLSKITEWGIYANSDVDSNTYRIKHILKQIPKGVSNQSEKGQYPINYKGLILDYSEREETWVIITRGEGEIRHATFFVGDA